MYEINILHAEAASVEIRQNAAVRCEAETQRIGVERLEFAVVALVELAILTTMRSATRARS